MKLPRALLFVLASAVAASGLQGGAPVLSAAVEWNSNVTNSDRDADVIPALELDVGLGTELGRISLGHDDTLVISAEGRAEIFPRFEELSQFIIGPEVAWRHKFGLGALAPVFSLELGADGIAARDSDRSGFAGRVRLEWSQRLNDATRFTLSYELARHDAQQTVYDRTGREAAVGISTAIDENWQVAVGGQWREGDVLSYATPPRPDIVALARVRMPVDTFGSPRVAYSLSARTLGGSVGLTRVLDARSSLTLGYEGRVTERSPLRYVNHLVSAAFNRQF